MKQTATFKKDEKVFLLTCLIFFFLLIVFLFIDVCKKSEIQADDEGIIGKILFMSDDVWREFTTRGPLESLQRGSCILDGDTVITGANSTVSIALYDGSVVDLCRDSRAAFNQAPDEIRITLEKGCGDFRRTGDGISGAKRLAIVTDGKKVTVKEGELSLAREAGKMPELFVRSGRVTVLLENDEQTVRENERAVLKRDSVSIERKKLILTSPADSTRYFTTRDAADVAFSWKYNGSAADKEPYILEISRNIDFSRSYRKGSLADTVAKVPVPAGDYFWRVSRSDPATGRHDRSETRRFTVSPDAPLVLLNPSDGEVVEYVSELPSIGFTWKGHRYADSYRLEISDRRDFSKILRKIDSRVVDYTHQWEWDIDPGNVKTYYWRVTAANSTINWPGRTSTTSHFYIQRANRLNQPVLVSPKNRAKIIRPRAARENVIFSWEKTDASLKKKIYFSKESNFSGIYREVIAEPDHWLMKNTFPSGRYYWRIALYDDDGNQKVFSGARSFVVQEIEDITLVSPDDRSELVISDIGDRGIRFKWEKPDVEGTSILEVSKSREFKTVQKSARTSSNTVTVEGLSPGNFFWRVKLQNDRDRVLAGSETRAFAIHGGLAEPVVISPRRGGAVKMLTENELNFLWRPSRQANAYQLELHQLVKEKRKIRDKLVLATQTGDVKYTVSDLNLLDVGNFYWTLRAVKKDRRGKVVRFSKTLKNNFNINLGASNIIIISPEIQVIEDNETK